MTPPIPLLRRVFFLFLFLGALTAQAQSPDPEFRKGWLLTAKITNGMVTDFSGATADLYAGGLGLNPQITVVPNLLRIGANASMLYTDKEISGLFGPMAALKIKTFKAGEFGTIANMHLLAEANWGTEKQQMAGAGLGFEILKLAHLGLTVQRDYHWNRWWLQSFIAIRLNKHRPYDTDLYSR